MTVAIETLEGLKRQITLSLDAKKVQTEKQKRLQDIARRAKIDGFRPGKVPMKYVQTQYGAQTEQDVINQMLSDDYHKIIRENGLKTAGNPVVQPADKEHEYVLNFEVMPEFTVNMIDGVEIEKVEATVSQEDVEKMLETLRKQRATWSAIETPAQLGDRITIDFEGKVDDVAFPGGSAQGQALVLGSASMIPGFEEALIGVTPNSQVTFDVTFPSDYQAESLRGKLATFAVSVHQVEAAELPELDAEFAIAFGVANGNLEQLKQELQRNMERELNNTLRNKLKTQLLDQLLVANPISVPTTLVEKEVLALAERSKLPQPKDAEQFEQLLKIAHQVFGKEAERRVRLSLLLSQYVEQQQIKLDESYVNARLALVASTYEEPEAIQAHFRQDKEMMASLRNLALEDQLVDVLSAHVILKPVPSSFTEVMQPKQA